MTLEPVKFNFKLSDLPGYEHIAKKDLHQKVSDFFNDYFKNMGGETLIEMNQDTVVVQWFPVSMQDTEAAIQTAVAFLQKGETAQGEAMLAALHERYPDHAAILYNYGMVLSDKSDVKKAISLLSLLAKLEPKNSRAWNALAVAYNRSGDRQKALAALQESHSHDPEDPYALRNLGGALAKDDPEKGLPYLEKAAQLLPDDPQAQYACGLCMMQSNHLDDADAFFQKVIALVPYTEYAEKAKEARTEISRINMRNKADGQLRPDAVMYCLAALEKFKEMGLQKTQTITYEIAMLGRSGLKINDPDHKYHLESMDGEFTGMQLLSYMYVGLKQLDPELDSGIDLEKEYEAALDMFRQESQLHEPTS